MLSPASRLANALSILLWAPGLLVSAVIRARSKNELGRQLDVYDADSLHTSLPSPAGKQYQLYAAERASPPPPLTIVPSHRRRHSRASAAVANASWRDHTNRSQPRLESLAPLEPVLQLANITWDDRLLYDFLADVMERFAAHKVPVSLSWGSLLGSRRHHSIVPWDNQDADLWVFSTDHTLIASVLGELQHSRYPKSSWYNKSFGYHIDISLVEHRYVDLWLYEETAAGDSVQCTGHRGSCLSWYTWCKRKKCDPHAKPPVFLLSDVFPLVVRPFGPYLLPSPRRADVILAEHYGTTWRSICPAHFREDRDPWVTALSTPVLGPADREVREGDNQGSREDLSPRACMSTTFGPLPCPKGFGCTQFYAWYPFVFDEPDGTETLQINSTVLQRFNQSLEHPLRRPCVWRGVAEIYCHPAHGRRRQRQWRRGRPAGSVRSRRRPTRLEVSDAVLVEARGWR